MCSSMKPCSFFWSDFTLSEKSKFIRPVSLSGKSCRPLFEEMSHAFLEIFALQALDHFLLGYFKSLGQRLKHGVVNLIFYDPFRSRAHTIGQIFGVSINILHKTALRKDLVHQSHSQGIVGVPQACRKQHVEGVRRSD